MKWALRIAAALAVLVLVGLGLLALLLPRLAESEAVRGRIEAAAREALGRELRYRALDFALLPPSLVVVEPEIAGAAPEDPALVRAERVVLRVALLPLLARRVVVDSLVVEQAALHLVRSVDGLELPEPPAGEPEEPAPSREPRETDGEAESGAGIAIAVRRLALRDATVVLEDRALTPPVTWRVEALDLEASGTRPDAPLEIAGSLRLASGGTLEIAGTATLDGVVDLALSLGQLELAPVAPYLQEAVPGVRMEGRLGGEIAVAGPAADPERLVAELRIEDTAVAAGEAELAGPLELAAEITRPLSRAAGPFRVDATAARVAFGSGFAKPAGTKAALRGRLATGEAGALAAEDLALDLYEAALRGRLQVTPRLAAVLRAEAVPLAGWEALLPTLPATLGGAVAIPRLDVALDPLALDGSVQLQDVVVGLPQRAPLTLRGAVDAQGSALRTRGLEVRAADQPFRVDAVVNDLAGEPRFEVELAAQAVRAEALLAAFAGKEDALYGPLDVSGALRGRVSEQPLLDTLTGRLDFAIEGGRIVGVSLLEAVFDRLGALGGFAIEAGRVFGGRDLQRFYGDEFDAMRGRLQVAGGGVRAEELSLTYRGYAADLTGTVGLSDLALALQGTLTLFEEIDAEIAQRAGLGSAYQPRRRTLPLAAVGGTLDAPEVQISRNAAAQLVAAYAGPSLRDRLGREAEKELGPGAGEAARRGLEALEGILGGKKER